MRQTNQILFKSYTRKVLIRHSQSSINTALVVSDAVFEKYVNMDSVVTYWNFCLPSKLIEANGLMRSIMDVNEILRPSGLFYESYLNNFGRQLFYVISGSYTTLYIFQSFFVLFFMIGFIRL